DSEFASKTKEVLDPLSGFNRVMTSFNDKFYIYVLAPTARGYAYVVPETARIGIDNFFTNLFFPIRFTNNLLQLKFQNASEELGRFLMNT
ncbi:MlaA family lipoprotein, partial [Aliarcobacter butzleri]